MSAPDTNIEKQKRRHFTPLAGMALVIGAIVAFIALSQMAPDDDATMTVIEANQ